MKRWIPVRSVSLIGLVALLSLTSGRPAGAEPLVLSDAAGALATVEVTGDTVHLKVRGEAAEIVGVLKGDKRKYASGGQAVAEVKFADTGFKLKSPDGTLRWKVKYQEDRVKVAADEAKQDALELRPVENGGVKVKRGEEEVARLTADAGGTALKIKSAGGEEAFTASGPLPKVAHGVLALKDVPAVDRAILIGELIAAGR